MQAGLYLVLSKCWFLSGNISQTFSLSNFTVTTIVQMTIFLLGRQQQPLPHCSLFSSVNTTAVRVVLKMIWLWCVLARNPMRASCRSWDKIRMLNLFWKVPCEPASRAFYFCLRPCLFPPGLLYSRHLSVPIWTERGLSGRQSPAHSSGSSSAPSPDSLFLWSFIALPTVIDALIRRHLLFPLLILPTVVYLLPSIASGSLHKLLKCLLGDESINACEHTSKQGETWGMLFKSWVCWRDWIVVKSRMI